SFGIHGIGGAGGKVGPDLASIGASAPADYILESMLEPSAKIKENYHSLIVETDQGKVITGVKLRETNDSLILRDAEDREIVIPLDSIDEKSDGGSLMPAGLLNDLTQQETYDLLRFLTELGKIGEYALPREPYVRTWQTLRAGADIGSRTESSIVTAGKLPWTNIYSRVAGDLPGDELPRHRPRNSKGDVSLMRFPLEMSSNGTRTLRLDQTDGVRVYIDGQPIATQSESQLQLDAGKHYVTLVVDDGATKNAIRVAVE
ncbi:MAG: sorbosone dehydrogenase, partial [Planctomycetota bacterium]